MSIVDALGGVAGFGLYAGVFLGCVLLITVKIILKD